MFLYPYHGKKILIIQPIYASYSVIYLSQVSPQCLGKQAQLIHSLPRTKLLQPRQRN